MAYIYPKSSSSGYDECLVLNPREAASRLFNMSGSFAGSTSITGSWTEIRIGLYYGLPVWNSASLASSSFNAVAANETAWINSPFDWWSFGIKDTETQILPGYSGSNFIGIGVPLVTPGGANQYVNRLNGQLGGIGGSSNVYSYATNGTYVASSSTQLPPAFDFVQDPSAASAYNAFYGLRIIINNSGSVSQSLGIQGCYTNPIGTNSTYYTPYQLIQDMNTFASANSSASIQWWSGSANNPLPIPDGFWWRLPLYNCCTRFSALAIKRYV